MIKESEITYGVRNKLEIKKSDVIFAFLEKNNPSGLGLSLEIGYGIGLGIVTILINEKFDINYLDQISDWVDYYCYDFKKGIELLHSFPECKVFLCGGLKNDWQDIVKFNCPHHKYYDPIIKDF